jgi:hypothetical protein
VNSAWTSDRSQLGVDTSKAVLVTEATYDETCVGFFKMLLTKKELLKKIPGSEKYSGFASSF